MGIYDFDKNDKVVRFAILSEYDYADQYDENNRLSMNTLTIDHIIAESISENKLEFDRVKKEFDLDDDFNVNSLLNYLPTSFSFNNKKSDLFFSRYHMDLALKKAKAKAPKILSRIEYLRSERKTDKLVAQLFETLKTDEDFEKIAKQLFERENTIKSEKSESSYINMKKNVELKSFSPERNQYFGGFLIKFNIYDLSGMSITPNYDFLINSLFIRINYPCKDRSFVKGQLEKKGNYFIGIGDACFNINEECLNDLCEITDDFFYWYTDRLIDIEKKKQTLNAILFDRNKYLFETINIYDWYDIQNYIYDFVAHNGEFNYFEYNPYSIKVWNGRDGNGLHLCVYSVILKNTVYLTWDENFLNEKNYWSYGKALNWFYNILLVEVEAYKKLKTNTLRKGWLKSKKKKIVSNIQYNSKKSNYNVYIDNSLTISNADFLEIILRLESFYLVSRDLLLNDDDLTMLFKAMILLISKLSHDDVSYLKGNLFFISRRNLYDTIKNNYDLIKAIENEIIEIENGNRLIYSLEFVFRNIKVCAEDCYKSLSSAEMKLILDELQPLIDYYNRRKVLEKFNNLKKNEIIYELL